MVDEKQKISKDAETLRYLALLGADFEKAYKVAEQARAKKVDPSPYVEITPASDVAARVEGIVGPKGIAKLIRALEADGSSRQTVAYLVVKKIVNQEFECGIDKSDKRALIDQAVRTGVGILTEGVLVAPTEGISDFQVLNNQDGSDYLAIYFAGPIRSAGGTVAALAVVLGDVARRELGVGDFRPTESLIKRYVEEIGIYGTRSAHLQYKPTDEEIQHIVRSCPVCIDGDPTEDDEVQVNRDVPGIRSNRVRSGIALVICEGIAQKAAKVNKYTKKIKLDWNWLEPLMKVARKEGSGPPKPDFRYIDESVAGRALFAYPSAKGGWRLRYGRSRGTGIMGKAVHPASMYVLDSFLAIGTQMKIERPGKSTVVTACDSILGPVVKLKDGSVVEIDSVDRAFALAKAGDVEKVLFNGDILVSVGDFLKSNHPLIPGAWCEERFALEARKAGVGGIRSDLSAGEAVALCRKHGLALHPRYTYFWHDVNHEQLRQLALWLKTGKPNYGILKLESFELEASPAKSVLEELCVPHTVEAGKIKIAGEHAYAILKTLGIMVDKKITDEKFESLFDEKKPVLELLTQLSGMRIMPKAPTYIGSRMGRPEKARERKMKKSVNSLFPVGGAIDRNSSVTKVYNKLKLRTEREGRGVELEIARMKCGTCGKAALSSGCSCGESAYLVRTCPRCGKTVQGEKCRACDVTATFYGKRQVDVISLYENAAERCGLALSSMPDVKGVDGMMSESKIPEPLEKGMLRAKHGVFVFRDGTCRFDATDIPLTHFTPDEMSISASRLRELGYSHDKDGKPLENGKQMVALCPQDIILSRNGAEYLLSVSKFVDDMLEKLYGLPPFYNLKAKEEIVGQLVIGLSPHTSAGVLARVVGLTDAHVGFAHPYFHTAKRRNADGDEDTVILLMDGLLNFSRFFLPESRGGTMDAPLVLTTELDPNEVDDEAHSMEIVAEYPLELYELADRFASPSELQIDTVKKLLGTPAQHHSLPYTHETSLVAQGPLQSTYLKFEDMTEKITAQFALQEKLRAVDAADAAERLLLHHFLPDMYGNLRSFSQQEFRCLGCKVKYRRIPLSGKCNSCGGKLILTINKGGVIKYLKHAEELVERYHLPLYMKQRLELFRKDVHSIFTEEIEKQKGLADFM
ncbi:MAG: DNA polymerase II large subunit [Candidatus Micrarchaeota archaeon]|nr:DNA polymerase II large subunit [Candidatus Micrarchaeota archaeon]